MLSDYASLARDKKSDEIEVKTGGSKVRIALSIFV